MNKCFNDIEIDSLIKIEYNCVFWDYSISNWSSQGCIYSQLNKTHHHCQCDHLTNFGILMVNGSIYKIILIFNFF
jgi:hypothetical protein